MYILVWKNFLFTTSVGASWL